MKIVIDYQPRQNTSRLRGVGRVTYMLSKNIVKFYQNKKIEFLLNTSFKKNLGIVKKEIENFGPNIKLKTWNTKGNLSFFGNNHNDEFKKANKILKNKLSYKKPFIYLVTGLLDCLHENTYHYISKEKNIIKILIFYDLIPLKNKKNFLKSNYDFQKLYIKNLKTIKNFNKIFAISENVKQDLIKYLKISKNKISILPLSSDAYFKKIKISKEEKLSFLKKFNINERFILYLGPTDLRKNLIKLFEGFKIFKKKNDDNIKLVIVGSLGEEYQLYKDTLISLDLEGFVIFTNYVDDKDARFFYNLCTLFVFPSLGEGFGLPILEAMKCGANVICSNNSSIKEILLLKKNLFNPKNSYSIAKVIEDNLIEKNSIERKKLIYNITKKYNWNNTIKFFDKEIRKVYENITYL